MQFRTRRSDTFQDPAAGALLRLPSRPGSCCAVIWFAYLWSARIAVARRVLVQEGAPSWRAGRRTTSVQEAQYVFTTS